MSVYIYTFSGPLASFLMSIWGHRKVALLGAILTNIGLICMPFAPNLEFMYVFYGIITGKISKYDRVTMHQQKRDMEAIDTSKFSYVTVWLYS